MNKISGDASGLVEPICSPHDHFYPSFYAKSNRDSRYVVRKIVRYWHKGRKYLTLTQDLGLCGMTIENNHTLSRGECLPMELILGRRSISLKGRVVSSLRWSSRHIISNIQFTDMSEENRKHLQECLTLLEG